MSDRSIEPFEQEVIKPWGKEFIFSTPNTPITSKILFIEAGKRFSLQMHDVKEEILTLVEGRAKIYLGPDKDHVQVYDMVLMKGYFIAKNQIHRVEGVTDCKVFESSTPEAGKTIRLEDDYSRNDETEEDRKKRASADGVYKG